MSLRTALASLCVVASSLLLATPVAAVPGGRVDLSETTERTIDTRTGFGVPATGKVSFLEIGSGVLQVSIINPEDVGTAVIYPCDQASPTDRDTFRLDPQHPVQYTKIFAGEAACVIASTLVHIVVDNGGTVSTAVDETSDQYVSLATPIELSSETIASNSTLVIQRPPQVSVEATAAIVSLEVLLNTEPGFVTAYGCDDARPLEADLSHARGLVAGVAAIAIEPGEDLCIYSSSEVALRATLLGDLRPEGPTPDALPPRWSFVPGEVTAPSLRPINPVRVLDTRSGPNLDADDTLELGFDDVPGDDLVGPLTTAVSMNVTVANATDTGFLTVWPCNGARPQASNLNFTSSGAVPNLVVAQLSPDDTACISTSADADVIVDVNGTYERDGGLPAVAVEPERILDTRSGIGTSTSERVVAGGEIELQVTGGDVPMGAGAATLNVTATGSDANGFVTVYPCGSLRPTASNLNFRDGEAVPNLVTTALSDSGTVCLYTSETVHLVADLASWYGLGAPAGLVDLAPTRVLDTRVPIGVDAAGRTTASQITVLDFALTPSVAVDADAVVMNVTAAQAEDLGFVTVWPCDQTQPNVSNLNIRPGRTVANLTTVKLSAAGTVCIATTTSTHLIADVAGYLTDVPVDGDALVLDS